MSVNARQNNWNMIENGTVIRKHTTIHRIAAENSNTIVGRNRVLIPCSRIGYDCTVGSDVIRGDCALLPEVVTVSDHCVIGRRGFMRQHTHVGDETMLRGDSVLSLDLPLDGMSANRVNRNGLPAHGSSTQYDVSRKCSF
jgi:acyl-[acyl carrier protein]--UDP-N-acetylglucosamine O-acyltransferase